MIAREHVCARVQAQVIPQVTLPLPPADRVTFCAGLVRFVPQSNSSKTLIGEPVQDEVDVGVALRKGLDVAVDVFSGTSVLAPGDRTGKIEKVLRVLSPLAASEVGTIRCIGLNVC